MLVLLWCCVTSSRCPDLLAFRIRKLAQKLRLGGSLPLTKPIKYEEGEDDDDDDEAMGPGGLGGAAMMFNMLANGGIRMVWVVHDLMCVCVILFAWLTFCCLRGEGYCRGRRNGNGNARGVR